MAKKGSKFVRPARVAKWVKSNPKKSGAGGLLVVSLMMFLISLGVITPLEYSGDMNCSGVPGDYCVAWVKFLVNNDTFIYPSDDVNKWFIDTDREVKNVQLYRTWGKGFSEDNARQGNFKGLRRIDLDKPCTSTWCGAPRNAVDNKYSIALRQGKTYTWVYVIELYRPGEKVKWWWNEYNVPDPVFNPYAKEVKGSVDIKLYEGYDEILVHKKNVSWKTYFKNSTCKWLVSNGSYSTCYQENGTIVEERTQNKILKIPSYQYLNFSSGKELNTSGMGVWCWDEKSEIKVLCLSESLDGRGKYRPNTVNAGESVLEISYNDSLDVRSYVGHLYKVYEQDMKRNYKPVVGR